MGVNIRWPEPPRSLDVPLGEYLRELTRHLVLYDDELFSQDSKVLFNTTRIHPFTEVSAAYAMGVNDSVILADASASTLRVTLPTALDAKGLFYTIKRIDTVSVNSVSIEGSGAEFPVVLASGARASKSVFSDGSRFWVI